MLFELFPFVILNNALAFVYAYFFSDFRLLLLAVNPRGISNKHCLLSLLDTLFKVSPATQQFL